MKRVFALLLLASLAGPAFAQDEHRDPPLPEQTVKACRYDIHVYCSDARLRRECLVSRWTKLPDACQEALKTPKNGE